MSQFARARALKPDFKANIGDLVESQFARARALKHH